MLLVLHGIAVPSLEEFESKKQDVQEQPAPASFSHVSASCQMKPRFAGFAICPYTR